jgi:hypothetical protein
MTPREAVMAHLPPFGARVRAQHVIVASGLPAAIAWGAIGILCSEGAATVLDGWVYLGRFRDTAGAARRRAA